MARPRTSSKVSRAVFAARRLAHGSDQAHAASSLQGKDEHKIGILEIDVQFLVGRRPGRLHVGDVEQPRIGSARKADGELLPGRSMTRHRSPRDRRLRRVLRRHPAA